MLIGSILPAAATDANAARRVYYEMEPSMSAENLADLISTLTPEQQESVKQFVDFLKQRESAGQTPFLVAVEEFIEHHPELLRRLAR